MSCKARSYCDPALSGGRIFANRTRRCCGPVGFRMDGDGSLEIVTGGFFARKEHEQAELRVWKLRGEQITLIGSTSWGSESGHTRINSVRVGDVTGDGKPEIVSAGRTGQIKAGEHLT